MVEFKIVVSDPKTGKSYSFEAKDDVAESLIGKKIGDKIDGKLIELEGYELEITGGSDNAGFMMKKSIEGTQRKSIVVPKGKGFWKTRKGVRARRTFAGNTVYEKTAQINCKIIKYGKKPLENPTEENGQEEN